MQPIDGSYLYKLGGSVRPLGSISRSTTWSDAWLPIYVALSELETFMVGSVYARNVRTSRTSANALIALLKKLKEESEKPENKDLSVGQVEIWELSQAFNAFESIFSAEFGLMPIFLISPKKGYDLSSLVYHGNILFPSDLGAKVPDAKTDVDCGTRCMAFEMWTAAAFHFHRATESVLRKYWESVLPGRPHPGNKTIADYLKALARSRKGPPKLKAALKDLKDLDRNPVLHPEYSLTNIEETDALMGMIRNAMVQMLAKIPMPTP